MGLNGPASSESSSFRLKVAGTPATIVSGATSPLTTLPAATTALPPMIAPGSMTEFPYPYIVADVNHSGQLILKGVGDSGVSIVVVR
jgi:hypothetical protein